MEQLGETRVIRQSVFEWVNARLGVVEEFQDSDSAIEEVDEQPNVTVAEDQEPAKDRNYSCDSAGGLDADAAAETIR